MLAIRHRAFGVQTKPRGRVEVDRAHPLARGLLRAWALTEAGGRRTVDARTRIGTGTITGAVWDAGGLRFDAADDYVVLPDEAVTTALTAVVRATRSQAFADNRHLYSRHPGWFLSSSGALAHMRGAVTTAAEVSVEIAPWASLTLTVPYTYGLTYTGSSIRTFLDGRFRVSAAQSGSVNLTGFTRLATYHGRTDTTFDWPGRVDYAYLWARALSDTEQAWVHAEPYAMLVEVPRRLFVDFAAAAPEPPVTVGAYIPIFRPRRGR